MYTSDEILKKVNEALDALPYNRQPASLYDPIRYVLSLGGKRIRPVLMLLTYNLYKEQPEHIMMQALGLETYHNYTLLHDDLMDNATCVVDMKLCTNAGMPTRLSSQATPCWCWPMSAWRSAMLFICLQC